MTTLMVWLAMLAAGGVEAQAPEKKELQRPADWVTRADAGADASSTLYFVSMPPGWHITTGPGTILYDPKRTCAKRCRIEAEIFLFPGKAEGGYGVFLSGLHLEGEAQAGSGPAYDAFLLRWDGSHARTNWIGGARNPSFAWRPELAQYVEKGLPDKPVKNIITIEVDEQQDGVRVARFLVNGHEMYTERAHPKEGARPAYAGTVGLRVDAGVNLHVTRLDVVEKQAPDR